MGGQEAIVALVVALAAAYVIWRFFFAGRRPPRPKRGPDVPLRNLRRKPPRNE
jgi:hypothetical protein